MMATGYSEDQQRLYKGGFWPSPAGHFRQDAKESPWTSANNAGHDTAAVDAFPYFAPDFLRSEPLFAGLLTPYSSPGLLPMSPLTSLPLPADPTTWSDNMSTPVGSGVFHIMSATGPPLTVFEQGAAPDGQFPSSEHAVHAAQAPGDLFISEGLVTSAVDQSRDQSTKHSTCVEAASCTEAKEQQRVRPEITLSLLRSKYHLPISKAAKELGMGVTVMKKYCRKFGINRWPFRKLNSMSKLISSVQQSNPSGQDTLTSLVIEKQNIERDPCVNMRTQTKKLRQSSFKERYKMKHGGAMEQQMEPTPLPLLQPQQRCEAHHRFGLLETPPSIGNSAELSADSHQESQFRF